MSFSSDVKHELSNQSTDARHCQITELAVLLSFYGTIIASETRLQLRVTSESLSVARKVFTLVAKTFKINANVSSRRNMSKKNSIYTIWIKDHEVTSRILQATKMLDLPTQEKTIRGIVDPILLKRMCCMRSFVRGAFLSAGSMGDPGKAYHLEFVCLHIETAEQICHVLHGLSLDAKIVQRKKVHIVYLKESSQIVDLLNMMGAYVSLLDLENIRVLKEFRNSINRKVNCETANINKTVSAALRQVEDIQYLMEEGHGEDLPEGLFQIASARLEHPHATLAELGEMLTPSVGKSGVNHRLRKLSEMANEIRQQKEIL